MKSVTEGIRFIVRDLKSDGWRSIVTVINLTVFISCYFCLASLAEAGFKYGNQDIDPNQLIMISHNLFDLTDSQVQKSDFVPLEELIPSPVMAVSPLIVKHLNVNGYILQVRGAPLGDFEAIHHLTLLEGSWPTEAQQVVIGEGTVSLAHWKIGDQLTIFGKKFTITGYVRSPGTKFGSVWMSLENAESLFNTKGKYQFAWILLAPGTDAKAVMDQLNQDTRISGKFDVYYADQLYQQYTSALNDIKNISMMLVVLSLLLVMLGVYGSTYLTLSERKRELTILRSIGFGTQALRSILTLRTFVQVIFAYLLGWAITFGAIQWFQTIEPIMIHSVPLPVVISVKVSIIGLILSILFAWVGVLLPTMHLRRSSVISMIQR